MIKDNTFYRHLSGPMTCVVISPIGQWIYWIVGDHGVNEERTGAVLGRPAQINGKSTLSKRIIAIQEK